MGKAPAITDMHATIAADQEIGRVRQWHAKEGEVFYANEPFSRVVCWQKGTMDVDGVPMKVDERLAEVVAMWLNAHESLLLLNRINEDNKKEEEEETKVDVNG